MTDLTIEVKNDEMLGRTTEKALHITLIEQQKEIERLNKELKQFDTPMFVRLIEKQDKIDKAIEYIEERKELNWYADGVFVYELLEILQGEDK